LTTDDLPIVLVPHVIANCAPLAVVEDLNAPLAGLITSDETHCSNLIFVRYFQIGIGWIRTCNAGDASVVLMDAGSRARIDALLQLRLISSTSHFVHPDWTLSLAKLRITRHRIDSSEAELTTDDMPLILVPHVVTNCTPLAFAEDLNSPLADLSTSDETYASCVAGDGCVLAMLTVFVPPAAGKALPQLHLVPCAFHIVQPDFAFSFAKLRIAGYRQDSSVAELTTDDLPIVLVPHVIANCAPLAVVEDLNAPLAGLPTSDETHFNLFRVFYIRTG